MSSETQTRTGAAGDPVVWVGAIVAGLVAGAVMGGMLVMRMPMVVEAAIPALYGLQGTTAGLAAHMVHSAAFGVVFAALVTFTPLSNHADGLPGGLAIGVVYGALIWVGAAVVLMPVWLGAVGFPGAPPVPNVNVGSLVAHVVFGGVLGVLFTFVPRR